MSGTKGFALYFSIIVAFLWVGVGPRPADNSSPDGSDYQASTLQRLSTMQPTLANGPLRIGLAESDITPPIGLPLAGFSARYPKASDGVDTPLFARALTLSVADRRVTILTVEILLLDRKMTEAIYQRTGLTGEQLFFTASHTHNSSGGWGEGLIEELTLGAFDAGYFNRLANQLAATVQRSRQTLQPAELAVLQREMPGSQHNRLDRAQPTNDRMTALLLRAVGSEVAEPPMAILTFFGAHPTILGAKTHKISGDYPGYLVSHLKALSGAGMVLFAAGSVGDATPVRPDGKDYFERAEKYGRGLAEQLAMSILQAEYRQQVTLGSLHLPVDMPPIRYPISRDWTLGPLVSGLFGDNKSWLKGLRIGPLLLFGFPGDYAGHLATQLSEAVRQQTQLPVITATTSFNGDFKGYLVSRHWFETLDTYETRDVNFFGPWGGEYLNDLALKMAKRLLQEEY